MSSVAHATAEENELKARCPAPQTVVVHRWYLGGLASASAAACTHPLDLLKVGINGT